jgi:histidyl-tRNA synthetase
MDIVGRNVSKALSDADRRKINYAIIVGPEELKEGKVVLRNLATREQQIIDIENLFKNLKAMD